MAIHARHVIAALAAAFMIGIIAGGLGLFSGGGGSARTEVVGSGGAGSGQVELPGSALEERRKAAEREAAQQKTSARAKPGGDFTAEAERRGGRIYISGVAATRESGVPIVVQRKQSGQWNDFPANTRTGADGEYSVWVMTSQDKPTFRVKDEDSGDTSNPVTVES